MIGLVGTYLVYHLAAVFVVPPLAGIGGQFRLTLALRAGWGLVVAAVTDSPRGTVSLAYREFSAAAARPRLTAVFAW